MFFNNFFLWGGYYFAEMLFLVLGGDSRAEIHHFIQIEFLLMLKSTSTKKSSKRFSLGTKVGSNILIGR
jgi:hypothetical protein